MALSYRRMAVHTFLAGMSSAVFYASYWLMIVVLARLGGLEDVGRFSLAMAIVNPVALFFGLALRTVIALDVAYKHRFKDCFIIRCLGSASHLIFVQAIVHLLVFPMMTEVVITIFSGAKIADQFSDLFYGVLQRAHRFELIARSMILRALLGAVAFIAVYSQVHRLPEAVAAMALAWAMVAILHDWPAARLHCVKSVAQKPSETIADTTPAKSSWQRRIELVAASLPVGAALLLINFNEGVPRYLIAVFLGEESVGIFTAMAYIVIAGNVSFIALVQAVASRLAASVLQKDALTTRRIIAVLCMASVIIGLGGIVFAATFGRMFLVSVYGDGFAAESYVFIWIMTAGAAGLVATAFVAAATSLCITRPQPVIIFVSILVNISVGYALCPKYGLSGIAIGWTASNTLIAVLSFFFVYRYFRRAGHSAG